MSLLQSAEIYDAASPKSDFRARIRIAARMALSEAQLNIEPSYWVARAIEMLAVDEGIMSEWDGDPSSVSDETIIAAVNNLVAQTRIDMDPDGLKGVLIGIPETEVEDES